MAERVAPDGVPEAVVDPLEVERRVVADEDRARGSISPSLAGHLAWERWRDNAARVRSGRLFTPTDWRWTHPTRLALEGISTLALTGSGLAAVGTWPINRPPWYQIAGFSFLFAFGLLVTVFLHRSFTSGQTSSTEHEQRRSPHEPPLGAGHGMSECGVGIDRFLGVDLAWRESRPGLSANETGVAVLDPDGRVVDAGWTRGLDETVERVAAAGAEPALLFVDAPRVVDNSSGQRTCETQVGQRYGRWKVSANLRSPRQAGVVLRRRLEERDWQYSEGHSGPPADGRWCCECYPYTTLVDAPATS